jgi:uncharacterized YigZ family protein
MSRFQLIEVSRFQLEVKKSRFLATAYPLTTLQDLEPLLQEARLVTATHHCWAYRFDDHYRFSDDGEPSGTAGRPIFSAIDGQNIDHILIIVTRWYGGVNLGTGGLVRAYGGAASECLRTAKRAEIQATAEYSLFCDFSLMSGVHQILLRYQAEKLSEQFKETGLRLHIRVPSQHMQDINQKLNDLSRGATRLQPCDNITHEHTPHKF